MVTVLLSAIALNGCAGTKSPFAMSATGGGAKKNVIACGDSLIFGEQDAHSGRVACKKAT
eukprot:4701096-Amphidinium_carterae.1